MPITPPWGSNLHAETHRPARLSAAAPFGLPSFTPRALAAASASLVRREIASRSCWATSAMIPTVRSFASGMSTARNRTPLSRSVSRKAALRRQPVELGNHQRGAGHPGEVKRLRQLRPIRDLAALDLGEAGEDLGAALCCEVVDRLPLRLKPQAGATLPSRRDPLVGDQPERWGSAVDHVHTCLTLVAQVCTVARSGPRSVADHALIGLIRLCDQRNGPTRAERLRASRTSPGPRVSAS